MGTDCILVQKVTDNEYNRYSLDRFYVFMECPFLNTDSDNPIFYTDKEAALKWLNEWENIHELDKNDYYVAWIKIVIGVLEKSDLPFHIAADNDWDYLLEEGVKINRIDL